MKQPIWILLPLLTLATLAAAQETQIMHGPILGRLSETGVGVWARTAQPGTFRVHYGTAPDRLDRTSSQVSTTLEHDNTGWVHLQGLEPNTKYYYQLRAGGKLSGLGGSFRTLPRAEDYRHPELNPKGLFNFRFEFACGNNQTPGQGAGTELPAFKTMLEQLRDHVHFSILNGDWLYEDARDYAPAQWLAQVKARPEETPRTVQLAPTIVGVWQNLRADVLHL
jgi:phosphodiesterase/alkaline phosphatase D-like protein